MIRYYAIKDSIYPGGKTVMWGASRFGDGHDPEMEAAVAKHTTPGDGKAFCVGFTPEMPRMKTPEQCQAQRIRNMKRRALKEPLFVDQIIERELKKPYYGLDTAKRRQEERRAYFEKWISEWEKEHGPENEIRIDHRGRPNDLR